MWNTAPRLLVLAGALLVATGCRGSSDESAGTISATARPQDKLPVADVDVPREAGELRSAVFAGGCFWCVEAVFEELDGVKEAVSGYAGGAAATADYHAVSRGDTGHAEVVQVTYDPARITYGALLRVFFATHDPTQLDRQGPDVGSQYRSAVFYRTPDEQRVARAYIAQLEAAGAFARPIVTRLEPLEAFYPAEEYHQDFVRRNPEQGYVRAHALPKVDKVRKSFRDLLPGQETGQEPGSKPGQAADSRAGQGPAGE